MIVSRDKMAKGSKLMKGEEKLRLGRAALAIFALLVAAAHLGYTGSSFGGAPTMTSNQVHSTSGSGSSGFAGPSFNAMSFWFAVEVIAYTLIAVVFLLGLRTWYTLAMAFNAFNLVIYFLSGVIGIPGVTPGAFPGRFDIMLGLSSINIIIIGWVVVLVLGLIMLKYDPGSELDRLLVTRKISKQT